MKKLSKKTNYWLQYCFLIFFILNYSCKSTESSFLKDSNSSFEHIQIKTDTLYNSNQEINIIKLQNNPNDNYKIKFGYHKSLLKTTSNFAKSENAVGAINGGFFDMDKGGSVAYLEINDTVVNKTSSSGKKWSKSDSLINGAIIINKKNKVEIHAKKPDQFYYTSRQENAVMLTGPLLIQNKKKSKLFDSKFVYNRHPRTCLCKTKKSLLFVTIDGRSPNAQGMNLYELQDFLLKLGCIDAINLDGGGSTTMWIHDKGIVNQPSDANGERPVANALLIIRETLKN